MSGGILGCRRVGIGGKLKAVYGLNKVIVRHPRFFNTIYPAHIKSATFYGRVINSEYIINLDMSMTYDEQVSASKWRVCVPMFVCLCVCVCVCV